MPRNAWDDIDLDNVPLSHDPLEWYWPFDPLGDFHRVRLTDSIDLVRHYPDLYWDIWIAGRQVPDGG